MLQPVDRSRETLTVIGRIRQGHYVPGFEDVLEKAGITHGLIGEGRFYNTASSVGQLAVAISLSKSAAAREILNNQSLASGKEVIHALREGKILEGMSILDMGCGPQPGFGLAAQALGATVHGVDVRPLPGNVSRMLGSYTEVDLSSSDAMSKLQKNIEPGLDHVSECIIGYIPGTAGPTPPDVHTTIGIADALLIEGGMLYRHPNTTMVKV